MLFTFLALKQKINKGYNEQLHVMNGKKNVNCKMLVMKELTN